jgi:GDP-L-fucose synthase
MTDKPSLSLKGKRILITGGAGFIGSFLADNLIEKRGVDPADIVVPRSTEFDLRDSETCRRVIEGCEIVFHLAAQTGGIAFSRSHPASQYLSCSLINLNLFEAARQAGVEKLVSVGNLLAYPAKAESPLREETVHDGELAGTHLGIGQSKRDLLLMAEMYHQEYGMNVVTVLSANSYGPRDRFDPSVAHVIPATIIKCFEQSELNVWGDGSPTRDFLYVEDVAEGLARAAESLQSPTYVNIASGAETSIRDLVFLIARLSNFKGPINFDSSKGGGDPKRSASTDRAEELMGFKAQIGLEEGLRRTIEYYRTEIRGKA